MIGSSSRTITRLEDDGKIATSIWLISRPTTCVGVRQSIKSDDSGWLVFCKISCDIRPYFAN